MLTQTKPASPNTLASLQNVGLSFDKKQILHDISVELQADKILTLIGPNGAGKSSLVRILLGLQAADKGEVWTKPNLRIGYVPQKTHIEPLMPLTVERFIRLAAKKNIDSKLESVLDATGISHLTKQSVQQLSGGEFQRVLLARALLSKPQLLVLDEPAQGVDIIGQSELYELIANLKEVHGFGVLMVSHDLHLVMQKTDQVLCLNQHICCSGQPEDVSRHPEYLRLFGNIATDGLAVYTHHHDHCHDLHGDVMPGDACEHEEHQHEEHQDEHHTHG